MSRHLPCRLLAAFASWLVLCAPAAFAGQSPPGANTITLQQAIDEAGRNNRTLVADRLGVDVARAKVLTAGVRPNPVVSSVADHLDWLRPRFTELNGGGPSEISVGAEYTLERGGKRASRVAAATRERHIASWLAGDTERLLRQEVSEAFFDVLLARAQADLARENLAFMQQIVEINAARVRTGDLAEVELTRTRLAARQMENTVREREARRRTALVRLHVLLGRDGTPPADFDVAGDLVQPRVAFALEDLQRQARTARPDLQAAREEVARAEADIRLQRALAVPDFSIGAEYRRQQGVNAKSNSVGVSFSVPLPIFDRNQGEIVRSRREREQATLGAQEIEASVAADVQVAWLEYQAAGDQLDTIERQMLQEARQVREVTEYSYRRGSATLLELLDANRAFNETMEAFNEARAQYARSVSRLEAAAGKVHTL